MKIRVDRIFEDLKENYGFSKQSTFLGLLFPKRYTEEEVRSIWEKGVKLGIETGLYKTSIQGQRIELTNNIKNKRHKEFLTKSFELSEKYNIAIQYHYELGMIVVDLKPH